MCEHCHAAYIGWKGLLKHFDRNPAHDRHNAHITYHPSMYSGRGIPKLTVPPVRYEEIYGPEHVSVSPELVIDEELDFDDFDLKLLGYDLDPKCVDLMANAEEVGLVIFTVASTESLFVFIPHLSQLLVSILFLFCF